MGVITPQYGGIFPDRGSNWGLCIARWILQRWTTREAFSLSVLRCMALCFSLSLWILLLIWYTSSSPSPFPSSVYIWHGQLHTQNLFFSQPVLPTVAFITQSCLTLCNPMDCTVPGILQARILEWADFPASGASSQPRDQTQVSHIVGGFFTSWATREAPRILEGVAYLFSSGSSRPRNWTGVSLIAEGSFTNWAIREAVLPDKIVPVFLVTTLLPSSPPITMNADLSPVAG